MEGEINTVLLANPAKANFIGFGTFSTNYIAIIYFQSNFN